MKASLSSPGTIANFILDVQSRAVLLDLDLARLHAMSVRRLHALVHAHYHHFPGELCFQPDARDLPQGMGLRDVFTEAGAWMVAALLGSAAARTRAIEISRGFAQHARQRCTRDRAETARDYRFQILNSQFSTPPPGCPDERRHGMGQSSVKIEN